MVARYGDFVSTSTGQVTTVLLWAGPALLVVVGFAGLIHLVRARAERKRRSPPKNAIAQRASRRRRWKGLA
jgi:cytochrome c-type biogenesis protein CcmH/NrfF